MSKRSRAQFCASLTILLALLSTSALSQVPLRDDHSGPYNVTILEGGEGLTRKLEPGTASIEANGAWSMSGWVNPRRAHGGVSLLLSVGSSQQDGRALMIRAGNLSLWAGNQELRSDAAVRPGVWTFVAAVYDGKRARLYVNGSEVAAQDLEVSAAAPSIQVAPVIEHVPNTVHFGGQLAELKLHKEALTAKQLQARAQAKPDFALIVFYEVGGHWPWQVKQWRGLQEPQDPWTLPKGDAPFSKPVAKVIEPSAALLPQGPDAWTLKSWRLIEAPKVQASGAQISTAGFADSAWHVATVPGTVLTTLIDRGVYPDYDYGLNNMAIPESLARQDYWYRTEFEAPADTWRQTTDADLQGHQLRRRNLDQRQPARATSAALSSAASSTSPAASRPANATSSRCACRRRRIRAFLTRNPSPPGPEKTAAGWRSTARPSPRPKAGTGFPASVIATPASGRTSSSRPRAACGCWIPRSSRVFRCRKPTAPKCRSWCR